MKRELNAIISIAARDITKLLRDKTRILGSLIFPVVFIGALGGSLQSNLGATAGFNFLVFTFTGVLAQTLFQSTASGIISIIEDRQNDFAQELFISPISRYSILLGKIVGETTVALVQMIGIFVFGLVIGIPLDLVSLLHILPATLVIAFFGGAFGVIVMSNLADQRTANQIFPFLLFPQFFLAGVFNPIKQLPLPLWILSRIAPMTYAVDLLRSIYYAGKPEEKLVVLFPIWLDLTVVIGFSVVFLTVGTWLFVRNERNR